jgi:DNA-directed RNA polymerase specialized sigma24 family protein
VQGAAGATLGQNRDLGMSDDAFARHRRLLFTVAYEMLGSASGAGDVVQETWLRWADVDHASVREPRAYLVRIVTRQALNRLRTLARRREDYVGEWLPEPLVTSPDVAADVELARACRWRCSRCSRRSARQSAPSSCFARCSTPRMRDRRGGRQITCRRSPDRPREHVAARRPRVSVTATSKRRLWTGSLPPSGTATCRASSTSWPPTSLSSPTAAAW